MPIHLISKEFQSINNNLGTLPKKLKIPSMVTILQSVWSLWVRFFLLSIRITTYKILQLKVGKISFHIDLYPIDMWSYKQAVGFEIVRNLNCYWCKLSDNLDWAMRLHYHSLVANLALICQINYFPKKTCFKIYQFLRIFSKTFFTLI
jgi:hypothetical protein